MLVAGGAIVVYGAVIVAGVVECHVVAGSGVDDVCLCRYHSLCFRPRVCPSSGGGGLHSSPRARSCSRAVLESTTKGA